MQKEAEWEEKMRQRKEEREKQNDLKNKRPNRRHKRKLTETNDDVRRGKSQSNNTENIIETETTIGELKRFVKTSKTPCTKNDKRCKAPKLDNKPTVFPIVNKEQSLNRNFSCDLPFWFGRIEPFRGTKFSYIKQDNFLQRNQVLSGFVGKAKEGNISDEEDPLCGIKYQFQSLKKTPALKPPAENGTYLESNRICDIDNEETCNNLKLINNTGMENKSRALPYDCTSQDEVKTNDEIKPAQIIILGNDEILNQSDDEPPDEGPILRVSPVISHSKIDVTAIGNIIPTTRCDIPDNGTKLDQKTASSSPLSAEVKCVSSSNTENQERPKEYSNKKFENKNEPCFKRRSFKVIRKAPQPPTLLEKLLAKNVEKERDELLQCIRYVVDKKFLQN